MILKCFQNSKVIKLQGQRLLLGTIISGKPGEPVGQNVVKINENYD